MFLNCLEYLADSEENGMTLRPSLRTLVLALAVAVLPTAGAAQSASLDKPANAHDDRFGHD